jgi:uncharacterized protein YbaR (Trm112 family)
VELSQELLNILVCPKCKGGLTHEEELSALCCAECRLRYRIQEGIPVMLIDEATVMDEIPE